MPSRDRRASQACNADNVDAVAVTRAVWQVVPQMRAVDGHRFSARDNPHVAPHYLGVSKAWPAVSAALGDEIVPTATAWRNE